MRGEYPQMGALESTFSLYLFKSVFQQKNMQHVYDINNQMYIDNSGKKEEIK